MAVVYILHSLALDKFYTGSCRELILRTDQHINKLIKGSFTSKADDWRLFHVIEQLEYKQARSIEAHIKRMKSKRYITNLLLYPDITKRLRERYQ